MVASKSGCLWLQLLFSACVITQWLCLSKCYSLVGSRTCIPWWTFRHALFPVDDETVKIREVHFRAELWCDTAPTLKLVGARWAVGYAASFVGVMHTGSTCCITSRDCAAAQALGVAAFTIHCACLPCTLLWTLWRRQRKTLYSRRWITIIFLLLAVTF